jgi:DNA-binding transcriptional MerR regulator
MIDTTQVPDKKYFRIGEVSTLVGVDTHVLRYWETEFKIIKPFRGKSKQRLYRRKDVINLLKIKYLLHDHGYTINGARKLIQKSRNKSGSIDLSHVPSSSDNEIKIMVEVKRELQNIQSLLKKNK